MKTPFLYECPHCERESSQSGTCGFCGLPLGPVTFFQLAEYRLGRKPETGADMAEADLAIMGGCQVCGATLAAYNGCPSKSGYWKCENCIGDDGWTSVEEANRDIFRDDNLPIVENDKGGES